MGTNLEAAIDEAINGRHNRHDGGIPASLGARTSYDVKYAHQRMLKRKEAERVELERKERKRNQETTAAFFSFREPLPSAGLRRQQQDKIDAQVRVLERRKERVKLDVSLWQDYGWESWWELLRIAARKRKIQQADYNETDEKSDEVRYLLLHAHLEELADEEGFSIKTARAVAASIFVNGFAQWNLAHRDDSCTFDK
jgi:hypothetical protein